MNRHSDSFFKNVAGAIEEPNEGKTVQFYVDPNYWDWNDVGDVKAVHLAVAVGKKNEGVTRWELSICDDEREREKKEALAALDAFYAWAKKQIEGA